VSVRLFAIARQRAGRAEIAVDLVEPATVADLRRALAVECPELAPLLPNLMIAVNAEYADEGHAIPPGADLAAIPPVSGGALVSTQGLFERDGAVLPRSQALLGNAVPDAPRPSPLGATLPRRSTPVTTVTTGAPRPSALGANPAAERQRRHSQAELGNEWGWPLCEKDNGGDTNGGGAVGEPLS
jgi:molybdopterin converting factor small subunit